MVKIKRRSSQKQPGRQAGKTLTDPNRTTQKNSFNGFNYNYIFPSVTQFPDDGDDDDEANDDDDAKNLTKIYVCNCEWLTIVQFLKKKRKNETKNESFANFKHFGIKLRFCERVIIN